MLKRWVCSILLVGFLAPSGAFSQVSGMRDEASLFLQLKNSQPDTGRAKILVQLADHYLFRPQARVQEDSAVVWVRQARALNKTFRNLVVGDHLDLLQAKMDTSSRAPETLYLPLIKRCQGYGDRENERFAWELLGDATEAGKADSVKIGYYQHAMSLCRQLDDVEGELRVLNSIADVHLQQKKFDLAEGELWSIINNPRATPENLLFSYDLIGDRYSNMGHYDSALYYALKAEKLMETTGDSCFAISYLGRLSFIYLTWGKPELALDWSFRTLQHSIDWNYPQFLYPVSNSIFTCYSRMGKNREALDFMTAFTKRFKPASVDDRRLVLTDLATGYTALGRYDSAERRYQELMRLGNDNRMVYSAMWRARDNYTIGNFYFKKKAYGEAKKYLDSALGAYEGMQRADLVAEGHWSLFRADSALGNYVAAIGHLRAFQNYRDSSFSVSRSKQVEQLQIAYQTEKREKDLNQLQEKERVEKLQLTHANASRNWIFAASCLLLVIAVLLYRQNRARQKNSRMILDKNLLLEKLVREKEWLLKEVHHRVKNNLQTVICLLESQSAYLENDALKAIENSKHRIYAMSLIHQKLYRAEGIKAIDMSLYIGEFVHYLAESFGALASRVRIRQDVAPLELGVSQAIPIGLILNEAVTNCFKYAFPGGGDLGGAAGSGAGGEISIRLWLSSDQVNLVIADDGVGMSLAADGGEVNSLGIELMRGLARDLGGVLDIFAVRGVTIALSFPIDRFDVEPSQSFVGAFAGI
jgi:two-component sensor histidine kinase